MYRIRFSSITPDAIRFAVLHPGRLNANISAAVSVRRELDLKIGASFTRYFTNLIKCKFTEYPKKISYGPCQTPTLCFCVQSGREAENPQRHAVSKVKITLNNGKVLEEEFSDESAANQVVKSI